MERGSSMASGLAFGCLAYCLYLMISEHREETVVSAADCSAIPGRIMLQDGIRHRLLCANDLRLLNCGRLLDGDAVQFVGGSCQVRRGGMKTDWKFLYGIRVDPNIAALNDFTLVRGIGPTLAERLVAFRDRVPLKSVQDFDTVVGVGPKLLKRLGNFFEVPKSAMD